MSILQIFLFYLGRICTLKRNRLKRKQNLEVASGVNNYGMKLITIN